MNTTRPSLRSTTTRQASERRWSHEYQQANRKGPGCTPRGTRAGDQVRSHFKPEFLNRVDEIIFFHALGRAHLTSIIDIQLRQLAGRLEERKVTLVLTNAAKAYLVDEGLDPAYGARPFKRTIQRRVLDPLAMRILQGELGEGDQVAVDVLGDELRFEKAETVKT